MSTTIGSRSGPTATERVGVIFVHGIGEQRRFEFLNAQIRQILRAIKRRPGTEMSVEIAGAHAATLYAEQDTWLADGNGPVRAHIRQGGRELTLVFHEVWWADVNEPYSLAKQIRFWLWGLAVWAYPRSGRRPLPASAVVQHRFSRPPIPRDDALLFQAWVRMRLFLVGCVFFLGGLSVGLLTLLAERVFKLRAPDILRTLTNIVSGVKLYNQRRRFGTGFSIWPESQDFLDTLDEPPRVSVRRRMVRAIADVAEADYDRWYIIAHSLGTVVAFNGLMALPETWPGYFDLERWSLFRDNGFAGPARPDYDVAADTPTRPGWAERDVAYRSVIFARFRGLLTLGSPLAKFATIWPARVPIANLQAFRPHTEWLNVFDPLDPVSGTLQEFRERAPTCCPAPEAIGYRAHWLLLVSHLHYLTCKKDQCLADGVAHWLITQRSDLIRGNAHVCSPGDLRARNRWAWAQWCAIAGLLALVGGGTGGWMANKAGLPLTAPDFFGSLRWVTAAIVIATFIVVSAIGFGSSLRLRFRRRE